MDSATNDVLARFVADSDFHRHGGVVTDLDGTAVIEREGRIYVPQPVEFGLKRLKDVGRPIILNTLRFPLSVLRTFGEEWLKLTGTRIPTITLNGSLLGYVEAVDGALSFFEIDAFPLAASEIDEMLKGVDGLLSAGVLDLLVFHYPRDWREGELVWTPDASRVEHVAHKYRSAAQVHADGFQALRARLHEREVCMVFLLIELPHDKLMAYQHTKRSNFFTRKGVDKAHGARAMARKLSIRLADSVGAGDAELDNFLNDVGLALHVGSNDLSFKGQRETLKLADPMALGEALFRLADLKAETAPIV
ncbi:MAG TPA: HAD family phosphatase [Casimicrobiaceae bacterium]|nr:HAD family phosphatase [Casimicrobiaceae bacterium]